MVQESDNKRVRKLSYKIGLMILVTQVIAFVGLGVFYINRFTNQIDAGISQKFSTPGYLMAKGMLRYQTVQDKKTMESLLDEVIDNCMIIGANGKVYYSMDQQYQDKTIAEITFLNSFDELTKETKENTFIEKEEDGKTFLYAIEPLRLDDGKFLGYLFIKAHMERIVDEKRSIAWMFVIGSLLCIILTSVVIILMFNRWFAVKIEDIVGRIAAVAKGKPVDILSVEENDEIGVIKKSINELIKGTEGRVIFADEIAKGNFDADYEALSNEDLVGKSLLNMRDNLKHAQQLELERQKETDIQNWVTKGLANFADILRQDNDNIEKLSYAFIIELIHYMDANQGALFVINDSDPDDIYFEASAAMAYERKKTVDSKFRLGESLVGRAAYEKATIYMIEVPQDYVKITSGLGEANPNCVLLVPLIADKEVVGVIELISFIQFETYQIQFVEKLAVSLASTLINVKVNERTGRLLSESQKQREELMAQEEEVRQNLEEMTAIKEEAARKEEEMNSLWRAVKEENCVAIYELQGTILEANNQFIETFAEKIFDKNNMNIKDILKSGFVSEAAYHEFCQKVDSGRNQKITIELSKEGTTYRFMQSHVPMKNSSGSIDKVMSIGMVVK